MLAIENADAGGGEHLVPGDGVEIAIEIANIDGQVRRGLGPVQHDLRPVLMGQINNPPHRVDRPQGI